ncbi:MAG: Mu transposase C-terminal domain-containing protein [bacterium]
MIKQFLAAFNDGSLFRFCADIADSMDTIEGQALGGRAKGRLPILSNTSSDPDGASNFLPSIRADFPEGGSCTHSLRDTVASSSAMADATASDRTSAMPASSPSGYGNNPASPDKLPPVWVRRETLEIVGTVSLGTYYRWRSAYASAGVEGLLPGVLGGKSKSGEPRQVVGRKPILSEQAKKEICAMIFENPRRKTTAIYKYLQLQRPQSLAAISSTGKIPSYPTIQRYVNQLWKMHKSTFDYILSHSKSRSKWKGKHRLAIGNASEQVCWPNDRWEIDTSPADLICKDGKRQKLIALVDVRSRRAIVRMFPESSAWGIAQTLRAGFLAWGIPKEILRDNGLDYQANLVNQICDELGISTPKLPPYTPEKKPHVERFFRTLSEGLLSELSGYTGNSIVNRAPVIIEKYTAEEFQVLLNNYLANIYEENPHAGLNGMRPREAFHMPGWVARRVEERQLDILLMPAKPATVRKETVRYNNCLYYAPDLVNYEGQKLEIRIDLQDASKIYIFEPKNSPGPDAVQGSEGQPEQIHTVIRKSEARFICIARDPAAAGLTPGEIKKAQHRQTKHIEQVIAAQHALNSDLARDHGYDYEKDKDWRMQERLKQAGQKKPVQIRGPESETLDLNRYQAIVDAVEEMGTEGVEKSGQWSVVSGQQRQDTATTVRRPDLFGSDRERYEWCYERILEGNAGMVTDQDREHMARYEQTELYQRNRDYYESLARMYQMKKAAGGGR